MEFYFGFVVEWLLVFVSVIFLLVFDFIIFLELKEINVIVIEIYDDKEEVIVIFFFVNLRKDICINL